MKPHNVLIASFGFVLLGVTYVGFSTQDGGELSYSQLTTSTTSVQEISEVKEKVTHVPTPKEVRGVYMTSWVAGTPSIRKNMVALIDETEINSVVIDIKDYSGKIAFPLDDERITKYNPIETRISDIKEFIEELHEKDIYVIGRVTVFQDPHLANLRPDLAVQKSDGSVWKDFKGLSFTDPGFKEVWDYHVAIAEASYEIGFDEINFDYIRFPSDGNMKDIYFPGSEERVVGKPGIGKSEVIEEFFAYLSKELEGSGVVTSADLFGMTTTNYDDLNIGQVLEKALPHFDYIAPMVYPSHYPETFIGLANPAAHPYDVIKYSMDRAVARTVASTTHLKTMDGVLLSSATATPPIYSKEVFDKNKLRPWLQDFDLGAVYTPQMVRAQIDATYDAGLTSWMLWDAANTYTKNALKPFYIDTQTTGTPQN